MIQVNLQAQYNFPETLGFQGELYVIGGEVTVPAGTSYKVGFQSPKNIVLVRSRFRTTAHVARAYMHENVSYSGGTLTPPISRNRSINKPAAMTLSYGVTATTNGNIARIMYGEMAGGEAFTDMPMILKKNTPYVLNLMNDENSQSDKIFYTLFVCELDLPGA